jgi:hypothetical protein
MSEASVLKHKVKINLKVDAQKVSKLVSCGHPVSVKSKGMSTNRVHAYTLASNHPDSCLSTSRTILGFMG